MRYVAGSEVGGVCAYGMFLCQYVDRVRKGGDTITRGAGPGGINWESVC